MQPIKNYLKQDHQRWGYSTVIHLEQPVYLTTWKDLNKEKRKEHKIKIEPKKWGGWSCVCFFSPPAFEPSALRPYACKKNSNASSIFHSFGVLDHLGSFCTSLDHPEPFQTILDHFKPPCTISKAPMTSH